MTASERSSVCLVLLIGLPAAGKTTFAQKFVEEFTKLDFNVVHVCFDDHIDHSEQAKLAGIAEKLESAQTVAQNGDSTTTGLPSSAQNDASPKNSAQVEENLPKWKIRRREILGGVEQFLKNVSGKDCGREKSEVSEKILATFQSFG